jgi:hypothetical protein
MCVEWMQRTRHFRLKLRRAWLNLMFVLSKRLLPSLMRAQAVLHLLRRHHGHCGSRVLEIAVRVFHRAHVRHGVC